MLINKVIPQYVIDQIISVARIEEVIGEQVPLKKRGVNLLGLCPFHDEKTPSFTVSPTKGIYKCFGCGRAGNAVKFLMEHDQLTYPEALRQLADQYNIEIPEEAQSEEAVLAADRKEKLLVIMQFAQRFFEEQLHQTEAGQAIGLSYFKERGMSEDIIRAFHLGYSPDAWQALLEAASEAGYEPEDLVEVGLLRKKEDRYYDFFRDRVIFPIHNVAGKVIAFAGRTLKQDKKIPKYVNSPETDIYHKSKVLYGAFLAKAAMRQEDNCYLVEGYTDVIALYQGGIQNVVASSGTSLTGEQVKLIRRYTHNITVLYDGDPAGIKAAMRGVDLILEEDMQVRVVVLPEGEDPDSFIKAQGKTQFQQYLQKEATDFILFKLRRLQEETGDDPGSEADLIRQMVQTIAQIPDPLKRSTYLRRVAEMVNISESLLINELNKVIRQKLRKKARQEGLLHGPAEEEALAQDSAVKDDSPQPAPSDLYVQERDLLRVLMQHGAKPLPEEESTVAEMIVHELRFLKETFDIDASFRHPPFKLLYAEIQQRVDAGETPPEEKFFLHHPDEEISRMAIDVLADQLQISTNWEQRHGINTMEVPFINDVLSAFNRYITQLTTLTMRATEKAFREAQTPEEEIALLKRVQLVKKMEMRVIGNTVIKG